MNKLASPSWRAALLVLLCTYNAPSFCAFEPTEAELESEQALYSTLLRMGQRPFEKLKSIFDTAYQAIDLSPTLTDSYFADSPIYDVVALPIAQAPLSDFRIEMFTHLHDPKLSAYNQLNPNSVYHDLGSRQLSYMAEKNTLALGLGFVAPIQDNLLIKSVVSNHHIPGYGDSLFSVGVEFKY